MKLFNPFKIGVFVIADTIKKLNQQSTDMLQKDLVTGLIQANQIEKSKLYFFTKKNISYSKRTILGTYFNVRNRRWEQKQFPFPDVVYDQGMDPETKKKMDALHIKKINANSSLNKWEVHTILKKNARISPHLPYTIYRKTVTEDDLKNAFKRCPNLYIKACIGGSGTKVIKVSKIADDHYEYKYYLKKLYTGRVNHSSKLVEVINKMIQKRDIIIQEEIKLLRIQQSVIDLRAELHRNGNGELEIMAIIVRVGSQNSPISTFGERYLFDDFFQSYKNMIPFHHNIEALKQNVSQFMIQIYKEVEKAYGPFGEMGVDIALDENGKLWFIECNSKTLKVAFNILCDEDTKQKAYVNILRYAKYLHRES